MKITMVTFYSSPSCPRNCRCDICSERKADKRKVQIQMIDRVVNGLLLAVPLALIEVVVLNLIFR